MTSVQRSGDPFSDGIGRIASLVMSEETLQSVLELVVGLAETTIAATAGASVTLKQDGKLITAAHSTPLVTTIDRIQHDSGSGPCVCALREGINVRADDLTADERWPQFARGATELGVMSVLAVPLNPLGEPIGSLNIYSSEKHAFEGEPEELASALGKQSAVALANSESFFASAQTNDQLREALRSRDLIGQAKGIIMQREGVDAEQAFDLMRAESQKTNRKLRDIAEDVVRSSSDGRTS